MNEEEIVVAQVAVGEESLVDAEAEAVEKEMEESISRAKEALDKIDELKKESEEFTSLNNGTLINHARKMLEEFRKKGDGISATILASLLSEVDSSKDLSRLSCRLPGLRPSTVAYRDREAVDSLFKSAHEKMDKSRKYIFPPIKPVSGMVRKLMGEGRKREAQIFCTHLYGYISSKSLKDNSVFLAEVVRRIHSASFGKDDDLAGQIAGVVSILEERGW